MPGWEKWEKFTRPKQPSQQPEPVTEQHASPKEEKKKEKPIVLNSLEDLASVEIDETAETRVPQRKQGQGMRKQTSERQPNNKKPDQGRRKMAGENIDTSKYEVDEFKSWLKENKNKDFDELKTKNPLSLASLYEEWDKSKNNSNDNSGKGNEKGDENKEDKGPLGVSQGKADDEPHEETNTDWKKEKRDSWKAWCENKDNHNGIAYTYDEDSEATGLKFDVFKDAEKTEKLATIEYTSPNAVSIDNDNGKVPAYEFFDQLIKDAQKSGHSGIAFNGEMTDEFKTKLALACVANGMPMNGFEEQINIENLPDKGASLGDDLKKKIGYHNKYLMLQKAAENYKNDPEKKDQPYKIKEGLSAEDAALTFAACANAGIKVEGIKNIFKNFEGLIYTSDFEYMPKDAKETIAKHNKDIHNNMINRTKGKKVAGPVVARENNPENTPIKRNQQFFKQPHLVEKGEKTPNKQKRFESFILSGLKQKE